MSYSGFRKINEQRENEIEGYGRNELKESNQTGAIQFAEDKA